MVGGGEEETARGELSFLGSLVCLSSNADDPILPPCQTGLDAHLSSSASVSIARTTVIFWQLCGVFQERASFGRSSESQLRPRARCLPSWAARH